ncbi:MAG: hypothetical protein WC444_06915 [Candidatus Paceibacterota bacterium]
MRIERAMTPAEQEEEGHQPGQVTAEDIFMDKCNTFAQEYVKKHLPFCRKCALEEFKMKKQTLYNELKLRYNRDFKETEKPFLDLVASFDLAKYGHKDYFEVVGVERKNMRRREGGDVWFELVVNTSYSCKPYKHGCTVSIAQSDMNEAELAQEQKFVEERKKKISASSSAENLSVVGEEHKKMAVGTKMQTPAFNPSTN